MGEKLAWWLGITQPKFLYEIEEYKRMQEEEAAKSDDDQAEEIVVGADGQVVTPGHVIVEHAGIEQRLYNSHKQVNFNKKPMGEHLFQQSK